MAAGRFEKFNPEIPHTSESNFTDVYFQPILNLTQRALKKVVPEEIGWVDSFRDVITSRKKFYELNNDKFMLTDYRKSGDSPESNPLQIRLVVWEQNIDQEGNLISSNIDIKYFETISKKLRIVRLDNISDEIINDSRKLHTFYSLEKDFNMIEASPEEYYGFCLALMIGAR